MPAAQPWIILVTPVWKDSTRLAAFGGSLARALAVGKLPVRWIIADDDSRPDEIQLFEELQNRVAG